ncbi:hypothetical protein G6F68_021039 [Rhizopus microsporus]|nr:hypothetical protein G6F68_021039 [Rhizopus microsporus]
MDAAQLPARGDGGLGGGGHARLRAGRRTGLRLCGRLVVHPVASCGLRGGGRSGGVGLGRADDVGLCGRRPV